MGSEEERRRAAPRLSVRELEMEEEEVDRPHKRTRNLTISSHGTGGMFVARVVGCPAERKWLGERSEEKGGHSFTQVGNRGTMGSLGNYWGIQAERRLFRLSLCTTSDDGGGGAAAQRRMAAIPVAYAPGACGWRVLKQARPWLVAMALRRGVFCAARPKVGYFV